MLCLPFICLRICFFSGISTVIFSLYLIDYISNIIKCFSQLKINQRNGLSSQTAKEINVADSMV